MCNGVCLGGGGGATLFCKMIIWLDYLGGLDYLVFSFFSLFGGGGVEEGETKKQTGKALPEKA